MEKPTAKKGTSKVFKILGILGIILLVLIIAAAGVFLYYKNVKIEIIPVAVNPMNTELYSALIAANLIEDPVVDVQKDKVVIAFESTSQDQELFLVYYAFGAAYSIVPEASTVEVIAYRSSIATNYIVSMDDISAFNNGALTEKEFDEKVKKAS